MNTSETINESGMFDYLMERQHYLMERQRQEQQQEQKLADLKGPDKIQALIETKTIPELEAYIDELHDQSNALEIRSKVLSANITIHISGVAALFERIAKEWLIREVDEHMKVLAMVNASHMNQIALYHVQFNQVQEQLGIMYTEMSCLRTYLNAQQQQQQQQPLFADHRVSRNGS